MAPQSAPAMQLSTTFRGTSLVLCLFPQLGIFNSMKWCSKWKDKSEVLWLLYFWTVKLTTRIFWCYSLLVKEWNHASRPSRQILVSFVYFLKWLAVLEWNPEPPASTLATRNTKCGPYKIIVCLCLFWDIWLYRISRLLLTVPLRAGLTRSTLHRFIYRTLIRI